MGPQLSSPLFQGLAAALALSLSAYILPAMSAPAGCVWRGTAPFCEGSTCEYGEITKARQKASSDPAFGNWCTTGSKILCCKPESASPPAANAEPNPAAEDKKTPAVGNAATEVIHPAERVKKTPGVGNAATEVIHEGKKDKKNPLVSEALLLKSSKNLLLPRRPPEEPNSNNRKEKKRTTSTIKASSISTITTITTDNPLRSVGEGMRAVGE